MYVTTNPIVLPECYSSFESLVQFGYRYFNFCRLFFTFDTNASEIPATSFRSGSIHYTLLQADRGIAPTIFSHYLINRSVDRDSNAGHVVLTRSAVTCCSRFSLVAFLLKGWNLSSNFWSKIFLTLVNRCREFKLCFHCLDIAGQLQVSICASTWPLKPTDLL